jgi:hypothetical protein
LRGNGGVGARRRRDLKWALRAAPYPSASRPPFPSRERIEAKAPANPILPLGEVSRRDGGAGARSAEVFAHWSSHPLRPRLRQGYGEPTSPRAGKISTPLKSAPYSPSIHVVGGESSVFSGVDVRDVSADPAGSSGHGRQQTRMREAPNPCYCISGLTGLPHASHSSVPARGGFGASPSSPFFAKATKGTSPPREKDNSEASLSPRGEDERSEGEGALPLLPAPVVLAFLSTLTDERR